ncbi:MAG: choline/ethanolamine kinase family protein, partial [Hungatella sp.]
CLKAGMTNKSFLFRIRDRHYICRIPGPGTELLINRKQEQAVYEMVKPLDITEHILYFNGDTGYKIAEFYEGARNSDAGNPEDVTSCMQVLKQLHRAHLTIGHRFDMRERIGFYEKLCRSHGNLLFEDYEEVRGWMQELLDYLDKLGRPEYLSHIDSVADNFLFLPDGRIRLIDWEYAGMCDPLIDVAMCAIYSYYDEDEVERLMQIYLERTPTQEERLVMDAYIALGGFLWSLWAVYKASLGEEFGEYTIIMYRYAKTYYRKFLQNL